jgi:hypothetical protein
MKKVLFSLICAIAWLATGSVATAQEPQCTDLQWGDWIAERPYIPNSCAGVVERGGTLYAKFNARMQRMFNNGDVTLRIYAPDGSWEVDTFRPPADFKAAVPGPTGEEYVSFADIPTGKDIRVYVPEGQFTLVSFEEDVIVEAVVVPDRVEVVEVEEVVMPTTASPLPLIGLAGGLLVMLGGLAAAIRRRI